MGVWLWRCPSPDCTVMFFKGNEGVCPRCGAQGEAVMWAIRPPRGVDDPGEN